MRRIMLYPALAFVALLAACASDSTMPEWGTLGSGGFSADDGPHGSGSGFTPRTSGHQMGSGGVTDDRGLGSGSGGFTTSGGGWTGSGSLTAETDSSGTAFGGKMIGSGG